MQSRYKTNIILLICEILILAVTAAVSFFIGMREHNVLSPGLDNWQSIYIALENGTWSVAEGMIEVSDGEEADLIYGPYMSLPRGSYSVSIDYLCDSPQTFDVHSFEKGQAIIKSDSEILDPSVQSVTAHFTLTEPIDDLEIRVHYNGSGRVEIVNINVVSSTFYFRKVLTYFAVIFVLIDLFLLAYDLVCRRTAAEAKPKPSRQGYLDTIKFLAIFWICLTHFISIFYPGLLALWTTRPYSFLLSGVTGKLMVAVLGVIMCHLAYRSSEENAARYILKRYMYFVIADALISLLYIRFGLYTGPVGILEFLKEIFLLGDGYFDTFWCMRAFFAASVIAYINGRGRVNAVVIAVEILILCLIGWDFTAICLMGCLISALLGYDKVKAVFANRIVKTAVCILIFFVIKRNEGTVTYYIDGISSALFLAVTECSDLLKRILSIPKPLAGGGRYTMSVFLIHVFVFCSFGTAVISLLNAESAAVMPVVFAVSMMPVMVSAILLQKMLDIWNKMIARAVS